MANTVPYLLGMDAVINIDGVVCNVKDVTLNLSAAMADVTTRCNNGWRAQAPTLKECTVDFELLPDETGDSGLDSAFIDGDILTGVTITAGSSVFTGDFTVTSLTRNEPLEDAVTYSVTLSLVKFTSFT